MLNLFRNHASSGLVDYPRVQPYLVNPPCHVFFYEQCNISKTACREEAGLLTHQRPQPGLPVLLIRTVCLTCLTDRPTARAIDRFDGHSPLTSRFFTGGCTQGRLRCFSHVLYRIM